MSEVAKYIYVDDTEHVARIKKGIEKKQRSMARAIALVWDPQHITKTQYARAKNIEKQGFVTARCIKNSLRNIFYSFFYEIVYKIINFAKKCINFKKFCKKDLVFKKQVCIFAMLERNALAMRRP